MSSCKNPAVSTQYKQVCSDKTLQANSEGFFREFCGKIVENLGASFMIKFGQLQSDQARIQAINRDEKARSLISDIFVNVTEIYREKNEENAEVLRGKADKCLKEKKFDEARHLFSQSILKAPNKSPGLPLTFLGRAETLRNPSLALTDVQTAMKLGLPDNLKPKAFLKMAECYASLGEHKRSEVSLKVAQKLEPSLTLSPNNRYITIPKLKQIPSINNPHEKYTNASYQIRVNQNEDLGRFVEASKNIKAGDTLVVESAFSACLFPERFGTHCQHCFERLQAPYPCEECSNVAYCGPECEVKAARYHKFECKFLELLIGSGMSALGYIALRMVTQSGIYQNIEDYERKIGAYGLCTNAGARDGFDFFQRTLMALFLFRILKKSGYFGGATKNGSVLPSGEDECKIAEILLFNLQMLQFNAHEITEKLYADKQDRFKNTRLLEIGVAVYPTVALFNHDCYPAVTRYFVGKNIVVKATRPLQPGDIVTENYGPIFTKRNLAQRQTALMGRYWFNCRCLACTEDWPELKTGLDSIQERIKCPKCSHFCSLSQSTTKCARCQTQVDLNENLKLLEQCKKSYRKADELMAAQKPQEAIDVLCPALDLFHKISSPPHKATHLAEEVLRSCLSDLGNSYEGLVAKKIASNDTKAKIDSKK